MLAVYLIVSLKPKRLGIKMTQQLHALQPVIQLIEAGLTQNLEESLLIASFLPKFQELLKDSAWLNAQFKQAHPEHYQQYLLYLDPLERFSIVSFVWGEGQKTPIHNHEVWGVIGVLEGAEISTRFTHHKEGLFPAIQSDYLAVGEVDWFTPETGDIHAVENAFKDQVSISIHIYGANIGKVERFIYQIDGTKKSFISGYSNDK